MSLLYTIYIYINVYIFVTFVKKKTLTHLNYTIMIKRSDHIKKLSEKLFCVLVLRT